MTPLPDGATRGAGGDRAPATGQRRVAVIGGGWAGLAAALTATARGHAVALFEMAPQLGGRARQVDGSAGSGSPVALDNGQHILIGAYTETLRLMREVGVDIDRALLRQPLQLVDPHGFGLRLPGGPPLPAFVRGVLSRRGWPLRHRMALLAASAGWWRRGFACEEALTVAELTAVLPAAVRDELIEPLCVAALNTPAGEASARVFLRVLRDALLAGPGSADLLLPRRSLSELLPQPATHWLMAHGARIALGHRVQALERLADGAGWRVDGERFDAVVLAATAVEAARLAEPVDMRWAGRAAALRYEPIITVYLDCPGTRLPQAMLTLRSDGGGSASRPRQPGGAGFASGVTDAMATAWPAQFVFDLGTLTGASGRLALVASGAQPWVDAGKERTVAAALAQAEALLAPHLKARPTLLRCLTEKRATFRCTPGLQRPSAHIAPGLLAAGDYVAGPYPATLEGAVRSGIAAAALLVAGNPVGSGFTDSNEAPRRMRLARRKAPP